MTLERIQFVDSISSTATVRLSLSAEPWRVLLAGTDVSPPPLRRSVVSTLLADGSIIPAASYDNRTVTLHLQLDASSPDVAATQIQLLHRELDRQTNILRWQPEPSLPAVYFETFRSPDTTDVVDHGINLYDFTIAIPAKPFSLGERENLSNAVVSNDPNAGSGRFFDIAAGTIKGDVEVPLRVTIAGSSVVGRQSLFATRRRGTPSAAPYALQAETLTMGTDTTVVGATDASGGGASPSGAASNSVQTTFSNNGYIVRLSTTAFPAAPSVDARGTYRVLAKVRGATSVFTMKLEHGIRAIQNNSVTATLTSNVYTYVDLGLVQMPEGVDPITDGPGGLPLSVVGVPLKFYATRVSGAGFLIWDHFLLVPADDKFGIVQWGSTTPTSFVIDGASRSIYGVDGSGRVADIGSTAITGDFPTVSPNVANRVSYVNDVTPNMSTSDPVASTVTLALSYWPRYLTVRPVLS